MVVKVLQLEPKNQCSLKPFQTFQTISNRPNTFEKHNIRARQCIIIKDAEFARLVFVHLSSVSILQYGNSSFLSCEKVFIKTIKAKQRLNATGRFKFFQSRRIVKNVTSKHISFSSGFFFQFINRLNLLWKPITRLERTVSSNKRCKLF